MSGTGTVDVCEEARTYSGRSPRVGRLVEQIMSRGVSFLREAEPFARELALYRAPEELSAVQTRARMLLELVKLSRLEVYEDWSLAGEHLCQFWPLADEKWEARIPELERLGVPADRVGRLRDRVLRFGLHRGPFYAIGPGTPEYSRGLGTWSADSKAYWAYGWSENHSVRDYPKLVRMGFAGLRDEILERMRSARISDPGFPESEDFWQAGLWVCEAGILLGQRYAELARRMAGEASDPQERARLTRMAEACERVPGEGARTLFEAVQALWFGHILTCGEDLINANSIGRLDQMLEPYYQADLAAGRITRDEAVELMEELACKLYAEYDVQAIVLGGRTRDGRCAVNAMSEIILEATGNVGFVRDVSVRLTPDTPSDFVDRCAGVVIRGGGIPFFFNDESFIPALTDRGIALEDARDYAPIGCIELTIPGRALPHAVSGWFHATKCLELALFNGCDPRTGEQMGPETGLLTDFASYDQLMEAFRKQMEFFIERMVYLINRGELRQREQGPLPLWSVLTDDCIARGRDITNGGPVYNYHSICFLGTANVADSLAAVKHLVFERGEVGKEELLSALRANFEGYEVLRQRLLKDAPKYGNDCDEVDQIAAWLDNWFIDQMDQYRSSLGGRFFVHLFTFLCNIMFGQGLGATPDGRLAGQPIAYSLSAHQGRDERGLTAMLNTLAKLPHHRAAGASAAIIDINPSMLAGSDGAQRLGQIIRAAMRMGVGQMQINVVTVDRLRKAQQDPERYGNIPVRVAGYSQMFKLLSPDLQEHVIARTKHQ
ncbi:MAG: hypothetical protein GXY33_14430 [Phycisphaerae bacterium]|nr:hypothetical protein [Phycisphaerae bacterium]